MREEVGGVEGGREGHFNGMGQRSAVSLLRSPQSGVQLCPFMFGVVDESSATLRLRQGVEFAISSTKN